MSEAFTSLNISQCQTPKSHTFNLVRHLIVNQLKFVTVGGIKMKNQTTVKLALRVMKLLSLHKVISSEHLITILKPQSCTLCGERFGDKSMLEAPGSTHRQMTISNKNPKNMTVAELKSELRKLNVSTVGTKDILIKRLEMKIAGGC